MSGSIDLGTIHAGVALDLSQLNLDELKVKYAVRELSANLSNLTANPARMNAGLGQMRRGAQQTTRVISDRFKRLGEEVAAAAEKSTATMKKALDNQRAYEFKHNQLSLGEYKDYLGNRLSDFKTYSRDYMGVLAKIDDADARSQRDAVKRYQDNQKKMRGAPVGEAAQQARQTLVNGAANVALGVGAAGLAAGGISASKAADFDEEARHTNQALGLVGKGFDDLKERVLALSKDPRIVQSPADLMAALYPILSLPKYNTLEKAMPVLKLSAYAATAGRTSAMESQDVLTSALLSGLPGTKDPRKVMDTIFQGVQTGKYEFPDLSQDFGTVLSTAKLLPGVSLQDVTAGQALLTGPGGLKLPEANTAMNNFLAHILHPDPQSMAAMQSMGIKYGANSLKGRTLTDYLEDSRARMEDYAGTHSSIPISDKKARPITGYGDILSIVFPELRAMKGGALLSQTGEDNFRKYHGIIDAATKNNALGSAVDQQTQGALTQKQKLDQTIDRIEIGLGTRLLPKLERFAKVIEGLADGFDKLDKKSGGKAGDALLYGTLAVGGVGGAVKIGGALKGFFELFKDSKLTAGLPKISTALSGVAGFFTRLAGINLSAGALGILARIGLIGAVVATAGAAAYGIKKDYDAGHEAYVLNRGTDAREAAMRNDPSKAKRLRYQAITNRAKAADIDELIPKVKAGLAKAIADQEKARHIIGGNPTLYDGPIAEKRAFLAKAPGDAIALRRDADHFMAEARALTPRLVRQIVDGIETPEAKATCALFASKFLHQMGGHVPTIASAKGLRDYVASHGGVQVPLSQSRPNDLIVLHGGQYGARQANGQRSGYHVGVNAGGGYMWQSSNGVKSKVRINTGAATAYQVPGVSSDGPASGGPAEHFDFPESPIAVAQQEAAHQKAVSKFQKTLKAKQAAAKKALQAHLKLLKRFDDALNHVSSAVNLSMGTDGPMAFSQMDNALNTETGIRAKDKVTGALSQADGLKKAFLSGKMTLRDYIAALAKLRDQFKETDAAWIKLQSDIDAGFSTASAKQKKADHAKGQAIIAAAKAPKGKPSSGALDAGDEPNASRPEQFTPVYNAILSIPDAMGEAVGLSMEKWRGFGHFFKDTFQNIASGIKSIFARLVADLVTQWAAQKIMGGLMGGGGFSIGGGSGGGGGGAGLLGGILGGLFGHHGGSGGVDTSAYQPGNPYSIPGINGTPGGGVGGALSNSLGIAGLFGKGGMLGGLWAKGGLMAHGGLFSTSGALGGFGAALPWIGGGLMLNSMLGNPLGKVFKGIKKLFHFNSGGLVPGVGFHDTVHAKLTPGEAVLPQKLVQAVMRGAGGGETHYPITVNHYGDVYGHNGKQSAASDMAWLIKQQLPVATPGT